MPETYTKAQVEWRFARERYHALDSLGDALSGRGHYAAANLAWARAYAQKARSLQLRQQSEDAVRPMRRGL